MLRALSAPLKIAGAHSLCARFPGALRQVTGFLLRHPTHPRRQIGQGNSCVCGLHPHSGRLPGCVPPPIFQSIATSDGISPAPPYASSMANWPRQFLCLRASSTLRQITGMRPSAHFPEHCNKRRDFSRATPRILDGKLAKAIPVFAGFIHTPADYRTRSLCSRFPGALRRATGCIPDCPTHPRRQIGCCTTPHRSRLFGAVPRAGPVQ